jgi:signal transduction histidine kinase
MVSAQRPGGRSRDDLAELLERSTEQVDRLLRLMDDLLDISRIQSGSMVLRAEPKDLAQLVSDVVERNRMVLERTGSTIELHANKVCGLWDRSRVEQVVLNLLTNAAKYGAGKPIEIEVTKDGDYAKLSVRDHGIGIEEEDQERIFARFERAVSVRHFGGFGLGLYIAREIVRAHGGSIHVESRMGGGSTFTVLLPLVPGTIQPRGPRCPSTE